VRKLGYQALGFVVWEGWKREMRRRFGDAPAKIAAGSAVVLILIGLILAQRRRGSLDD
jgi:hypothetical protein